MTTVLAHEWTVWVKRHHGASEDVYIERMEREPQLHEIIERVDNETHLLRARIVEISKYQPRYADPGLSFWEVKAREEYAVQNKRSRQLALNQHVSVRRGRDEFVGIIVRFDEGWVVVRRTNKEWADAPLLYAEEDDVRPLVLGPNRGQF